MVTVSQESISSRVKFIYSEKATKFCEISTEDLTVTTFNKSMVEISQKFVAFSEYMNFNSLAEIAQKSCELLLRSGDGGEAVVIFWEN